MNFDHPDLQYLLWMTETARLRPEICLQLLELLGSPQAVWMTEAGRLERLAPLDEWEKARIANRSLARSGEILESCRRQNIQILTIWDRAYPDRLRSIQDPPLALYVRGKLPDLNRLPAVAVVGQRRATPYGLIVAERLGFQLSQSGVVVVSGLALGIDGASHKGAVKGATPAVAVFGTPIDECYPPQNAGLLRAVLYNGAAVSEYPPGHKTGRSAFPRRNRIISGMSLGVVVAEAPRKSGSLITASLALDQGRDVFAVPGGVDTPSSEGCNELIARGAKLVRTARDILEEYAGLYRFGPAEESESPLYPTEEAPAAEPAARPDSAESEPSGVSPEPMEKERPDSRPVGQADPAELPPKEPAEPPVCPPEGQTGPRYDLNPRPGRLSPDVQPLEKEPSFPRENPARRGPIWWKEETPLPPEPRPTPKVTLEAVFGRQEEDPVLAALDGPTSLEELSRRTGLDTGALMGKLTLLELKGLLRQLPGQIYEKR